jgi:hypothetical protein
VSEAAPSLAGVPRAAAVAGVAFARLFGAALVLVRLSIPGSGVLKPAATASAAAFRSRTEDGEGKSCNPGL